MSTKRSTGRRGLFLTALNKSRTHRWPRRKDQKSFPPLERFSHRRTPQIQTSDTVYQIRSSNTRELGPPSCRPSLRSHGTSPKLCPLPPSTSPPPRARQGWLSVRPYLSCTPQSASAPRRLVHHHSWPAAHRAAPALPSLPTPSTQQAWSHAPQPCFKTRTNTRARGWPSRRQVSNKGCRQQEQSPMHLDEVLLPWLAAHYAYLCLSSVPRLLARYVVPWRPCFARTSRGRELL